MSSNQLQDYQVIPATTCLVIIQVVYLGTFVIFYRFRRLELIQKRLPNFIFICTIANMLATDFFATNLFPSFQALLPCYFDFWFYYLMMPMWMYLNLIRDLHILFLHYLNQARFMASDVESKTTAGLMSTMNSFDKGIFMFCKWLKINLKKDWFFKSKKQFSTTETGVKISGAMSSVAFESVRSRNLSLNDRGGVTREDSGGSGPREQAESVEDSITRLSSFNLNDIFKLLFIILVVEVIILVVVSYYFPTFTIAQTRYHPCPASQGNPYNALFALIVIYLIKKFCFLFSLRKIEDTFYYRLESILGFLSVTSTYTMYQLNIPNYFHVSALWSFIGCIFLHVFNVILPVAAALLDRRSQRKQINADDLTFEQVMSDPALLRTLKGIMAGTFCLENMLFHEEYMDFIQEVKGHTNQTGSLNGGSILRSMNGRGEAMVKSKLKMLRQKYLVENAPYGLNISFSLRKKFIENYAKDPKDITAIEQIHKEVLNLIMQNSYPRLLRSIAVGKKGNEGKKGRT